MLSRKRLLSEKEVRAELFWDIWSANQSRLKNCCNRWLKGNHAKVEDALSQAREKAYHHYTGSTLEIRNPFSWLCRLTYHICIDIQRDQKKQWGLAEQVSNQPEQFYFSAGMTEPLEELISREDTLNYVSEVMTTLPTELQSVMFHRFVEELEYPEIASLLSITTANVRKRVQLARKRLRELM